MLSRLRSTLAWILGFGRSSRKRDSVLQEYTKWVGQVGPALVATDSLHVPPSKRDVKSTVPRLVVGPPPPLATPRSLLAADLGHARVSIGGGRGHVVHPFRLAESGVWCVACAVCGASGPGTVPALSLPCPGRPVPSSWGDRVLKGLARGRYKVNKAWFTLTQPWVTVSLLGAGGAAPVVDRL